MALPSPRPLHYQQRFHGQDGLWLAGWIWSGPLLTFSLKYRLSLVKPKIHPQGLPDLVFAFISLASPFAILFSHLEWVGPLARSWDVYLTAYCRSLAVISQPSWPRDGA